MTIYKKLSRCVKFTKETQEMILGKIMDGCFPQVAAQAAGVSMHTLDKWLKDERPQYKKFQERFHAALAEARSKCETVVHKTNPLAWLKNGPGRHRVDAKGNVIEGWAESVRMDQQVKTQGILMSVETQGLLAAINEVLAEYPELRAQIAQRLAAAVAPPTPPIPVLIEAPKLPEPDPGFVVELPEPDLELLAECEPEAVLEE